MDTRTYSQINIIKAISALNIKEPKNGMENWLLQILGELRGKHGSSLTQKVIMHQLAQAFYTGIVEGSLHKDEKYLALFETINVDDIFTRTLFEAMTNHKNQSSSGLEFVFPKHTCTDKTLEQLAKAMRDPHFPHDVKFNFTRPKDQVAGGTKFSDAGIDKLLEALDDQPDVDVKIIISNERGFCSPDKLQTLEAKLAECSQHYQDAHKRKPLLRKKDKAQAKAKTNGHKKLEEPSDKPKKDSKSKSAKKPGLFARMKPKKEDDKKKKGTRHSPRGSRSSDSE